MTANKQQTDDEVVQLRARVAELESNNVELQKQVQHLLHQLFGRKSERGDDNHPKLPFPGEEPAPPPPPHVDEAPDEESEEVPFKRRKRGATRISKDLPRETTKLELPEEQRRCPCCNEVMQPIGEEVTERIDYAPASLKVLETIRVKYACKKHEEAGVATPTLPPQPIEKGMATAGLLAHVAVAKYKDHLPLYRQSSIFSRHGFEIAESTLGDWIKGIAGILQPVVVAQKVSILESKVVQSDDTSITVLDPSHANGSRRSFLWAYVGDRDEVVFDFTAGRGREGPRLFLGDYRGHLQVDAYAGYDVVLHTGRIVEVGWWAHARRRFFNALGAEKGHAGYAIAALRRLYEIEREAKELGLDFSARRDLRQKEARPLLDAMKPWLTALKPTVLPKSELGDAIGYTLRQSDPLTRYLENGYLEIDNNRVERQMRGVAVGRRNWLFAGSVRGGRATAVIYSLIECCRLANVDMVSYFADVLVRVATHPANRVDELLPAKWAVKFAPLVAQSADA